MPLSRRVKLAVWNYPDYISFDCTFSLCTHIPFPQCSPPAVSLCCTSDCQLFVLSCALCAVPCTRLAVLSTIISNPVYSNCPHLQVLLSSTPDSRSCSSLFFSSNRKWIAEECAVCTETLTAMPLSFCYSLSLNQLIQNSYLRVKVAMNCTALLKLSKCKAVLHMFLIRACQTLFCLYTKRANGISSSHFIPLCTKKKIPALDRYSVHCHKCNFGITGKNRFFLFWNSWTSLCTD